MKKYIYSILISLLVVSTLSARDVHVGRWIGNWTIFKSVDEMTGKVTSYAILTNLVKPLESMDFPYEDLTATLVIECDSQSKTVAISFSSIPTLTNTKLRGGYEELETRVKFDNDIDTVSIIHGIGSYDLVFESPEDILPKLVHSRTLLIELPWYREGDVYFKFKLKGLPKAIKKLNSIQNDCKLEP